MKNILKHKLSSLFILTGILILVFTTIELLIYPVFKSGGFAMGSFGGTIVNKNNNYQMYIPFALLCFIFSVIYYVTRDGKKFSLFNIPGYFHLAFTLFFTFAFMYGTFVLKYFKINVPDKLGLMLFFILPFVLLLIGQLIFIINLFVSLIIFGKQKKNNTDKFFS